jgi:hypothetical protein
MQKLWRIYRARRATGALMERPGAALSYLDEICRILFSSIPSAGRVIESMFDIFTHRMAKRK